MNGLLCPEQQVFIQAAVRGVGATVLELMDRIVEVDLGKERGTTVLRKGTSNVMINLVAYAHPVIEARYRYLPNHRCLPLPERCYTVSPVLQSSD